MKYLKLYETIRSSRANDRKRINSMEDSIEAIFIEMIDSRYELTLSLTDHPGNIGYISLESQDINTTKPISEYLENFHQFYDYINEKGYDFKDILYSLINQNRASVSLNRNYIKDEKGDNILFTDRSWEFVEQKLLEFGNNPIREVTIWITPLKTKWDDDIKQYVPLYKIG